MRCYDERIGICFAFDALLAAQSETAADDALLFCARDGVATCCYAAAAHVDAFAIVAVASADCATAPPYRDDRPAERRRHNDGSSGAGGVDADDDDVARDVYDDCPPETHDRQSSRDRAVRCKPMRRAVGR